MGRFDRKIILILFFTSIVPLLFSGYLVNRLLEETLSFGINRQINQGLQEVTDLYREMFRLRKLYYRLQADALTNDIRMSRKSYAGKKEDLVKFLKKYMIDNPWFEKIRVADRQNTILEIKADQTFLDSQWRKMTINRVIPPPEEKYLLQKLHAEITFVINRSHFNKFSRSGELTEIYKVFTSNLDNIKKGYAYGFFVAFGLVIMAVFLLGMFIARTITRRMAILSAATRRVSKGDLDFQVEVKGQDELSQLMRSFNMMVNELKENRDKIVYLEKVSGWQEIARRLAHEIKNPLTPINLAIQQVQGKYNGRDPKFTKLLNEAVDIISEEINSLKTLVQEFSEFAKLPDVNSTQESLKEFIDDFLLAYNYFSQQAEIVCEVPPHIEAGLDRLLFKRVLYNLISNSIQANSGRKPNIRIYAFTENSNLVIGIEDDGPGIPEKYRKKIFDPYFTTKETGTGLGLAIVKKIVLQHQGEIILRQNKTGGTTFLISLRS